jgi:hypothetical protein
MAKIIVEFSGWVECDSDKVKFLKLVTDDVITGTEWLGLSEDDRDDYIMEDYIEAQKTALDGGYEHLDIIIQNEDGSEVTANRTYS